MFTGLVEEVGTLSAVVWEQRSAHLRIAAQKILTDVQVGDSIAVNGVCLTVVTFSESDFVVDAVPETMRRTNLGSLAMGAPVNLERALRVGDRLGGHLVSGHVDGVGTIRAVRPEGLATILTVSAPRPLMRYVVEKGAICVDGVSLTVMDVADTSFRLSIIPHTGVHTTLAAAREGQRVNLECDMVAKYVEKLLSTRTPVNEGDSVGDGGLSLETLRKYGFA
ncbi:riboflavin synthase subunit alpha [Alicyclobacillus contaminans]|uniref:riboflavin synthase n=1 Tax=Alicyclobacillus contaminans TaxID=392016 RepID=UPI0003FB6CDC|nr:riboflavin synthase [Alicyclobacillus contaminans]GMA51544.1 riboflavin synthase subunit alpha [Alicyclobacillus contaminans]